MVAFVLFLVVCFFGSFKEALCWDNDELELFDLVEEINENFYTLLGLEESASVGDIKHAYRNLSRYLHPDRNKEPDAEIKFRQLAAVYEVLKDASKRTKYDEVLVNGLPNWRQPVYYYRRVQKMGLIEMSVLLSVILTVCQFLVVWSIYLEQKFEKERQFSLKKRKDRKKGKQQFEPVENDLLKAELEKLQKPKLSDLLPCLIVRATFYVVKSFPSLAMTMMEKLKCRVNPQKVEEEDESDESEDDSAAVEKIHRPKRKKMNFAENLPSAYDPDVSNPLHKEMQIGNDSALASTFESNKPSKELSEWTDEEIDLLRKAIIKFPGGTTERWEKIAQLVGRTVKEVTSKSKELKHKPSCAVDPSQQGISLSSLMSTSTKFSLPDDLSLREGHTPWNDGSQCSEGGTTARRRPHATAKAVERTLMIGAAQPRPKTQEETVEIAAAAVLDPQQWTQSQQRLLESAMVQFPRGTVDRWDRVAELVPGKTKEDCIRRCKHLSEIVKQKHLPNHPSSSDNVSSMS